MDQLADRIGITAQSLHRIETDKTLPDLRRIRDIATALNTTVDFLIPQETSLPPDQADKVFLRERGFDDDSAQEILDFMEFIRSKQKKQKTE